MTTPETYTANGWELQFAVNHLGHFALATGLHHALAAANRARVVSVASSGHGNADIDFNDMFVERRPYDPGVAYGQSKTAQILFAVEANRRWADDGITANALMPGGIWTNLQRHWDPDALAGMKAPTPRFWPVLLGLTRQQLGHSPKAVVQRHRLLDVAAAANAGDSVDWAHLASTFGYTDQSHLISHFRTVVGEPPAQCSTHHGRQ